MAYLLLKAHQNRNTVFVELVPRVGTNAKIFYFFPKR